jgi:antitoxin MazE
MRAAKWGNSLAVRIPAALAQKLGLQDGDEIAMEVDAAQRLIVERTKTRAERLAGLGRFHGWLPADFTFDRDEANAR